jgi:ComF family protein
MTVGLQNIWKAILDILFPAFCQGCGKESSLLCDDCINAMPLQEDQVCPYCYARGTEGAVCADCRSGALDALLSASVYAEKTLIAALIHALKYEFVKDLAVPMSMPLAKYVGDDRFKGYILCPVPLHKTRLKWRGFNQARLLALGTGARSGLEVRDLLERKSFSVPQMELKKEERIKNVKGAFRCIVPNPPPRILLVDDVATTLSTLEECAKALKEAGAEEVKAIVLARSY